MQQMSGAIARDLACLLLCGVGRGWLSGDAPLDATLLDMVVAGKAWTFRSNGVHDLHR